MKIKIYNVVLLIIVSVSIKAQDVDSLLNEAYNNLIEKKYEIAFEQSNQIVNPGLGDSSQIALANCYAGMCKEELGEFSEAIKYYKASVAHKVPRLDVYDRLSRLAKQQDEDDIYEFTLLEKLKSFPDFESEILDDLSSYYFKAKQYEKLLPVTRKLTEWYPEREKYYYYKAVCYQSMGRINDALASYDKTLELDPRHAGANYRKGLLLFDKGSEIFDARKKKYESISDPSRSDYFDYIKSLDEGKEILKRALPHILTAYENKPNDYLKGVLYKIYFRLEDKENSEKYK